MAEEKKGFILYADQRSIIELLTNEKAGELLKHIFSYVNDENPVNNDPLIMLAFEPIKLQLKRDLIKWESTKGSRSAAGKASAEARKLAKEIQQSSTKATNVKSVQQSSTNPTVSVNVNGNVTVKEKAIPTIEEFLAFALASKPNVSQEDVKLKYQSWVVNDWSVTRGGKTNPIKNWKSTLLNTIPFFGVVAPEYKSPHQKEYEHIMKEVNAENERQRLLKLENDTN
jgi:hypothetical protein